jgi:hypothetical protein
MKPFILFTFLISICSTFNVSAVVPSDAVLAAKAIKAIYDRNLPLAQIIDIDFAELSTTPSKLCVIVIYERRLNTLCPDSPIGPYFDKGYAACLNSSTNEVESVMPIISDESGC